MTKAEAFFASLPIPILQAPMLGASTPALALAVSRAGGLGSLALAGSPPADIEAEIAKVRADERPFAANLFVLATARPNAAVVEAAITRLAPFYAAQGLEPPAPPNDFAQDFDAQFSALVRAAPPAASFTFGILTRGQVEALHARDVLVVGTATTVAEAKAWAEVGADAICAQGMEAGGHRGSFLRPVEESLVGTMALVPVIKAAVDLPVIAAGGIMDGRGVAAGLALGAAAIQMGTAFLLADEASAVSPPWRRALESVGDDATRLTRAFSGRYARGIENDFMRRLRPVEDEIPAYPIQNRLTQPLRAAAAKAGDADAINLWAGQAVKLIQPGEAGELVRRWWAEARTTAAAVAARTSDSR
jgi:nitronate monooxygenase